MNKDNLDQISDWNGAVGRQWAALQLDLDAMIKPFGDAALVVAAAKPGQGVIDIGCGCGDTSIALALEVGQLGSVLGIDVSLPMLEVARVRAATAQLPNLDFSHADASTAELPAGIDLLYSRFGVMFINQQASALRHMRKALVSGGRIVFACWRTPRDNPWAMAPLVAARKVLNITPEPADPFAPGPFAFADEVRLHQILVDAGFEHVAIERFDAEVVLGKSVHAAAESSTRIGPVARLLRELGDQHLPVVVDAVKSAFEASANLDGRVIMKVSTWIVSARNPA